MDGGHLRPLDDGQKPTERSVKQVRVAEHDLHSQHEFLATTTTQAGPSI